MNNHDTGLLVSRLCHEVAGPISSISHGIDLLSEENDLELKALTDKSMKTLMHRLRFYRFAYGSLGGTQESLHQVRHLILPFLEDHSIPVHWPLLPHAIHDQKELQLLCVMVECALCFLGQKGELYVMARPGHLSLEGQGAHESEELRHALEDGAVKPIQGRWLVALAQGYTLALSPVDTGRITLEAKRVS